MRNDLTGRWGEETAAAYLRRRHYTIVAANYRCRLGEIDLIAENRDYLVFVEVKLRTNLRYGMPREYVTAKKQEKLEFVARHKQDRIRRTAELYLCEHPEQTKQPRFDVIEVYAPFGTETKRPEIRHLEDAFS